MIKKILACLVTVAISGYIFVHGFNHIQADVSVDEFHSEIFSHHDHESLAFDHHEHPSEIDHLHLEEFLKRSPNQKNLKSKSVISLVSFYDNHLKSSDTNSSFQLVNFVSGYILRSHLAYANPPLRI